MKFIDYRFRKLSCMYNIEVTGLDVRILIHTVSPAASAGRYKRPGPGQWGRRDGYTELVTRNGDAMSMSLVYA